MWTVPGTGRLGSLIVQRPRASWLPLPRFPDPFCQGKWLGVGFDLNSGGESIGSEIQTLPPST
jgi:hypothetical protein